jgi:hypothetical protein
MAKDAGISKAAATTVLNSVIDGITKALKKKKTARPLWWDLGLLLKSAAKLGRVEILKPLK